jgi:uncharacterized ion transporter superfamily protein YfcC
LKAVQKEKRKKEGEKTTNQELTAKKVLLIAVLTMAAIVPGCILYYAIILSTYPSIGVYSVFLSISIITALLLTLAYLLKKRRTEK